MNHDMLAGRRLRPWTMVATFLLSQLTFCTAQTAIVDSLPRSGVSLAELINEYRVKNGLRAIPVSRSLTRVAEAHVKDLQKNYQPGECNLHSWSANGPWKSCCYTGKEFACMWNKPREISGYKGDGYEITVGAHSTLPGDAMNPWLAVNEWAHSNPHRAVILNEGEWADSKWKAIGAAQSSNYASAWFGLEGD